VEVRLKDFMYTWCTFCIDVRSEREDYASQRLEEFRLYVCLYQGGGEILLQSMRVRNFIVSLGGHMWIKDKKNQRRFYYLKYYVKYVRYCLESHC